jgi:hypothetical protein
MPTSRVATNNAFFWKMAFPETTPLRNGSTVIVRPVTEAVKQHT